MDKNANIYRAPEDEIPAEDKARLEGYLTAKADEGEFARMRAEVEALQGKHNAQMGAGRAFPRDRPRTAGRG